MYSSDLDVSATGTFLAYTTTNGDIYVQRKDACGAPSWGASGALVCNASGTQVYPRVVADGAGGAIVVWRDQRPGAEGIYAQHVNASGVPQWSANGIPLCLVNSDKNYLTVLTDGAGGAIAAWMDARSGLEAIYAQRVSASGQVAPTVSVVEPTASQFRLSSPRPNPAQRGVVFDVDLPVSTSMSIRIFDVAGRLVRTLGDGIRLGPGTHTFDWDGRNDSHGPVQSGRYLIQVDLGDGRARSEPVVLIR
jgi:hypothetical protein